MIPFRPFISLRRIAIGKTLFLAMVWTYVTGLMPILISRIPLTAAHFYYIGSRYFLEYAICILFDIRDRVEDRKKNIRALPTILSDRSIRRLYYLSLLLSLAFTIMMLISGMSIVVFCLHAGSHLHLCIYLSSFHWEKR
jgi:4-hydroxybenzoate polyprenyltransferase